MRKAATSSVGHRFASLTTGVIAALLLSVFAFGGQAGAWVTPQLSASCAPDTGHYAWTINLHAEKDQKIEMSWGTGAFTSFQTTDFATAGAHAFTTGRGGTVLTVRYASDRNVKASATANSAICGTGTTGGTVAGSQQNGSDKSKDSKGTTCSGSSTNETGNHDGDHQHEDTSSSKSCTVAGSQQNNNDKNNGGNGNKGSTDKSKDSCGSTSTNETGNHDGDHQHEDTSSNTSCGTGTTGSTNNGGSQTCTGVAKILNHSDIEWSQGGQATVSFTMGKGCTGGQELSLVSYTAPSDTFSRETASQQRIFQAKTGIFGDQSGPHTYVLQVNVPSCYFQIDFVTGKPIAQLGPAESNNFYSDQGRLLAAVNGGSMSCNATTSGNETPEIVTPGSAFAGNPAETDSANGTGTVNWTPNGNAVAGFETAPNAIGSVTPIVEVPGGSNQQPANTTPAALQGGTVAGVQSLPSTSTSGTPVIPLAAMGLAIIALGGVLLRRRGAQR